MPKSGAKSGNLRQSARGNQRPAASAAATSTVDRVAPHNVEAEEGLLAACLMDESREVINSCIEAKLGPDYFYNPRHQIIFEALKELYSQGAQIDEIILAEKLDNKGQLEEIGGYPALNQLTNRIETTAHARYWLNIVRNKALLRRLIRTSMDTIEECHQSPESLDYLLEQVEHNIFEISQDRITDSAKPIKEPVDEAVNIIHAMLQRKGELTGVPSGFKDLDSLTFGFHAQEMIVLAARPSVGKTSLAMNVVEHVTLPPSKRFKAIPTLVFSLEMSAGQLALRMLCSHSRVSMKRIKDGFASAEEQRKLGQAAGELKQAPLWIDDSGQITILEMRAKARRMHVKQPLGLIIIDYMQLISGTDNRVPREQQISEISRGIKAMAKELKVPIMVLSQLNRESEKEKRQPRLSDLRESGAIEQDADVVLLLANKTKSDDKEARTEDSGQRNLIIAKQRNGPVGITTLAFNPDYTRFENYVADKL